MWKEFFEHHYTGLFTVFGKERLPAFVKYQIFTKVLLMILVFPLFHFIISLIMEHAGREVLTNYEIIQFGFSTPGIIVFSVIYLTSICIILLEFGGLLVINHYHLTTKKQEKIAVSSVLLYVLKKFPKFIGIGGVLSILFLFIFFAFARVNIFQRLGLVIQIPPFIMSYIDENIIFRSIYLIVILLLLVLAIRWIFSIHFILLENKRGLEALKASSALIRNHKKKFFMYLGTGVIAVVSVLGVIGLSWKGLVYLLEKMVLNTGFEEMVTVVCYVLTQVGFFLLSFIFMPVIVYYSTNAFYYLLNQKPSSIPLRTKETKSPMAMVMLQRRNRWIFFIGIIVVVVVLTGVNIYQVNAMRYNTAITAHKANVTEAVENTMDAVQVALQQGADYIEIDVQESKDGQLFLCHDTNLKRLTGMNVNTKDLTYEELQALDLSFFKQGTLKGTQIPLLEEVIKEVKNQSAILNIEIKVNTTMESIVPKVVSLIEKYDFEKQCVISSLNYDVLQEVHKHNRSIKVGYLMYLLTGDLDKLNVDFIGLEESIVTKDIVNQAHHLGMEVYVWTVNTPSQMQRFMQMGVDNIITDGVEKAQSIRQTLKENQYKEIFKK